VKLVDTQGKGVEAITEKGIIANGKEFELDCLIFSTGFELATPWTQKAGIEVTGREGQPLSDKWKNGPVTLHGHSTRNFPNCFFIQNTQAALSPNFLHVTGFQAAHVSYIISKCEKEGIRTIEPLHDAEESWVKKIVDSREKTRAFRAQCTPGYYVSNSNSKRFL
jgi:cation diffusion facilitator CzcD-associated flavoprotein CzcO